MSTKTCPKCGGVMRTTITDYAVTDQRYHEVPLDQRYNVMKCHACKYVEEPPIKDVSAGGK